MRMGLAGYASGKVPATTPTAAASMTITLSVAATGNVPAAVIVWRVAAGAVVPVPPDVVVRGKVAMRSASYAG